MSKSKSYPGLSSEILGKHKSKASVWLKASKAALVIGSSSYFLYGNSIKWSRRSLFAPRFGARCVFGSLQSAHSAKNHRYILKM